jgi:hypothetical protein
MKPLGEAQLKRQSFKPSIVLAAVLLLAGCSHRPRFQPIPGNYRLALDTKTGQRCLTATKPQSDFANSAELDEANRAGFPGELIPYCSDLARDFRQQ